MNKTLIMALSVALAACTTAGAPAPGERVTEMECEVGEVLVCDENTASRLKSDRTGCTCWSQSELDQY